jgi:hypothetical protein
MPDGQILTGATLNDQLSQLNQLLGEQKYGPADAVLRQFIPRRGGNSWPEARAAAIWALGMIHEGKPDAALAADLEKRLNDTRTMPPESEQVRVMSAITLGRLKAKETLPSLRKACPKFEPSPYPIINACGWAIEQLTGEVMPPPKTIQKVSHDWFLAPLE